MRTNTVGWVALAALASGALAGSASAQVRAPGLLNEFEVRQLVERGDPADHLRLSTHFAILGERHSAEARRHTAMAQSFGGNPNRNVGTGMAVHCRRLADLSAQSATTVRELSAYHEQAAAGKPATLPRDGARFENGAGAPAPTEKELNALAGKARTPTEHRALEEYFLTLATRYTAEANAHVAWAHTYRGTRIAQAAVHHDRLATLSRDSAKEATEAAAMHKQLAGIGR